MLHKNAIPAIIEFISREKLGYLCPPLKYIICKNNISCKYIKCQSISLVKPN